MIEALPHQDPSISLFLLLAKHGCAALSLVAAALAEEIRSVISSDLRIA
jgi:hypothetical protein